MLAQALDQHEQARRQLLTRGPQDLRPTPREGLAPEWGHHAILQQQRPQLIHDGRALVDETATNPMRGLQLELLGRFEWYEPHGGAARRFGDRLRVVEVILIRL